jgi:hypothetical protein
MRSRDLSLTPPPGPAGAMFVGATRYASPLAVLTLGPRWFRMVRQMRRMRGYVWHRVYYRAPLTLGTIAFFTDREELLKFARSREHAELVCWLTDTGRKKATAGWIRIYTAEEEGYTNGRWRAEDGALGHVETWAPLAAETEPRPVKHYFGGTR